MSNVENNFRNLHRNDSQFDFGGIPDEPPRISPSPQLNPHATPFTPSGNRYPMTDILDENRHPPQLSMTSFAGPRPANHFPQRGSAPLYPPPPPPTPPPRNHPVLSATVSTSLPPNICITPYRSNQSLSALDDFGMPHDPPPFQPTVSQSGDIRRLSDMRSHGPASDADLYAALASISRSVGNDGSHHAYHKEPAGYGVPHGFNGTASAFPTVPPPPGLASAHFDSSPYEDQLPRRRFFRDEVPPHLVGQYQAVLDAQAYPVPAEGLFRGLFINDVAPRGRAAEEEEQYIERADGYRGR